MDYKKLLKKYIEHVGNLEGVSFLMDYQRKNSSIEFTDEEWKELEKIEFEEYNQ